MLTRLTLPAFWMERGNTRFWIPTSVTSAEPDDLVVSMFETLEIKKLQDVCSEQLRWVLWRSTFVKKLRLNLVTLVNISFYIYSLVDLGEHDHQDRFAAGHIG